LAYNKQYWQKLCSDENKKLMGVEVLSRKERILQAAKERHAQRTQEQINQIQSRWDKRRRDYYNGLVDNVTGGKPVDSIKSKDLYERYYAIREAIKAKKNAGDIMKLFERFEQGWQIKLAWTDRKVAVNMMKVAQNYGETDVTGITSALKSGNYTLAKQEAKSLAKTIKSIQNDEKVLSVLIPDVNKWHKQFSSQELHKVYDAVESKLAQWNSLTLEQQQKKLQFEAYNFLGGNMHGVQQKYATWQVSQAAYIKKLGEVTDAIELSNISNAFINDIKPYKTQSKPYHKLVYDLENAIKAKDKDVAKLLYDEAKFKKEELINKAAKRKAKKTPLNIADTDAFSQARKDAAICDKGDGSLADKTLIDTAGKNWIAATKKEKDYIYDYTNHYCDVNEPLQGRKYFNNQSRSQFVEKVTNMTRYIERNELPRDMWFTRGDDGMGVIASRLRFAGSSMPNNLQGLVGMVMQEGGFMSTGSRKGKGFGHKSVILNIYAPKGTKAAYVEPISAFGRGAGRSWNGTDRFIEFSTEHETLFQRGTKMRITKVYQNGSQTFIDCEVIGQEVKDLVYVKDSDIGY
jgi:hypothetical protein